jgi:hypothetical protein
MQAMFHAVTKILAWLSLRTWDYVQVQKVSKLRYCYNLTEIKN